MKVELNKAYLLLSPRLVVLLTTVNSKQGTNATPIDFIIPVNYSPPVIMISLMPLGHTYKNISTTKEFVINVLDRRYSDKVMRCAARYQEGVNKLSQSGLHQYSSQLVKPPRVKEADLWMECKCMDEKNFGDHVAIFGEVVAAEVRDELMKGSDIDFSKMEPFLHITKDYAVETKIRKK